jgi:hypothetical protein
MSKGQNRDVWIDPTTFGTSKACKILAEMMNENVVSIYDKHKVLSFINHVIHKFQGTSYIPIDAYPGVRTQVMLLVRDDFLARADKMPYPPKFITFLKNVICYQHNFSAKYRKNNLYTWGMNMHRLFKKLDIDFTPNDVLDLLKDEKRLMRTHKRLKLKAFW